MSCQANSYFLSIHLSYCTGEVCGGTTNENDLGPFSAGSNTFLVKYVKSLIWKDNYCFVPELGYLLYIVHHVEAAAHNGGKHREHDFTDILVAFLCCFGYRRPSHIPGFLDYARRHNTYSTVIIIIIIIIIMIIIIMIIIIIKQYRLLSVYVPLDDCIYSISTTFNIINQINFIPIIPKSQSHRLSGLRRNLEERTNLRRNHRGGNPLPGWTDMQNNFTIKLTENLIKIK